MKRANENCNGSCRRALTSRGHDRSGRLTIDDELYSLPTGCARHCAALFHRVASVVLVSTDWRTGPSTYRPVCVSSGSPPFSQIAGFQQFAKFWVQHFRPRLLARMQPLTSTNISSRSPAASSETGPEVQVSVKRTILLRLSRSLLLPIPLGQKFVTHLST